MKLNKCSYLFAAALVAGTMGMTSCSSEDVVGVENVEGATTKLALGISVLDNNASTKAAAADVNLDGSIANIANVTVVPMIDGVAQNPINMGSYTGTSKTLYREASVLQTVNNFRVYGNLPTACNENAKFVMPETATANWEGEGLTTFAKPHPLYYYADAQKNGGYYLLTSESDWASILDDAWGSKTTNAIGTNNRVKISGVTYAVGTLAAAVLDGIKDVNEQIFFDGDSYEAATTKYSWADVKGAGGIEVVGMTVDGQTKEFTETFDENKEAGEVTIYDEATKGTLAAATPENKIKFESNKVENANIYCVVADEDAKSVTVNFRFQNNTTHKLQLNNGEVVENGGYFYMGVTLEKGADQQIFEKGKTTILNATVTDWGKGTLTPVKSTDVQVGIVISVDWAAGMAFDKEI